MMRRKLLALLAAAGWPVLGSGQEPDKVAKIGLIASLPLRPIQSFKAKLQQLGYVEGRNLVLEARFAEGRDDRYPTLAAELAALHVDVMVAWGTPAALAAKRATRTIPTVVVTGDVVNTGIVANLARPEANITGFVANNFELEIKRLELLKEVLPGLSHLAVLLNARNPLNAINLDVARRVAPKLSIGIEVFEVRASQEVEGALRRLVAARPQAALLGSDTLLLGNRTRIAETMNVNKIPAVYPFREYAEAGGFIAYGADIAILFQRAAEYVVRILRGERPSRLPVQQATAFELVINRKTATALGLKMSPAVLVRADEVID